jgi:hypothetical protein
LPDGRADVLWHRAHDENVRHLLDPRISSAIGRLELGRQLNRMQIEAAHLIGRIYHAFERLHGQNRNPSAPGYIRSIASDQPDEKAGSEATSPITDDEREQHNDRVQKRYVKLNNELEKLPAHGREIIENLCVDDMCVHDAHMQSIRYALDCVAARFHLDGAKSPPPRHDMRISSRRPVRSRRDNYATRPDPLREAIGQETNAARIKAGLEPLDDVQVTELWNRIKARKDREKFRAEKAVRKDVK